MSTDPPELSDLEELIYHYFIPNVNRALRGELVCQRLLETCRVQCNLLAAELVPLREYDLVLSVRRLQHHLHSSECVSLIGDKRILQVTTELRAIWRDLVPRLVTFTDFLPQIHRANANVTDRRTVDHASEDRKPDGPEGGCWLWWKGRRHDVPKGVVYRLLAFMWKKDSAMYGDLEPVFEDASFAPSTLRGRVSDANKVLEKIGVPWRLKTDAAARCLTKQPSV